MARQVTLDELYAELLDACGKDAGTAALAIIRDHLTAGDRLKIVHERALDEVPESMLQPVDLYTGPNVGDDDPTPADPPWCMARHRHPDGGDYCTMRPDHNLPHVSGDGQKINAVFWEEVGWHPYAGMTEEEIRAATSSADLGDARDVEPPASESRVRVESPLDTTLWKLTEAVADDVNRLMRADKVTKGELVAALKKTSDALTAMMERMEQ